METDRCPFCQTPREPDDWTCCDKAHLEHFRIVAQELVNAISAYVRGRGFHDPGLRRTMATNLTAARRAVEEAINA